MKEDAISFELAEPSHPESLLPAFGFEWWMLPAGLAFLLAILSLYLIIRKLAKKRSASLPRQEREMAFAEANTALAGIDSRTGREAAVRCSLVLRKYLASAANDPALFETHEEFLMRQDSLAVLTDESRAAAADEFSLLAALKYAPEEAGNEQTPEKVVEDSRVLLNVLHHGFRA